MLLKRSKARYNRFSEKQEKVFRYDRGKKTRTIILTALLAALTTVATMVSSASPTPTLG